jgi:hypothetical protein
MPAKNHRSTTICLYFGRDKILPLQAAVPLGLRTIETIATEDYSLSYGIQEAQIKG